MGKKKKEEEEEEKKKKEKTYSEYTDLNITAFPSAFRPRAH